MNGSGWENMAEKHNKGGPADRWQRRFFCEGHFLSKVSALSEFILYLPTAPDHIVISAIVIQFFL